MSHSITAPSSAARRLQCTASTTMELVYPEPDTGDSKAGTAAHEPAAEFVKLHTRAQPLPEFRPGLVASNGVPIDDDMYRHARLYADDIHAVMQRTGVFTPVIERSITIPRIHPESHGTPDCWLWDPAGRALWIWDYKYGWGIVEPRRNAQMVEYAAGILDELGIDGLEEQHVTVVFNIIQPRPSHPEGPIRRWDCKASDLRPLINKQSSAAHEALGPNPTCRTGPECKYCAARHACGTFQAAICEHRQYLGQPIHAELDAAGAGAELTLLQGMAEDIKARTTGLQAQIEGLIEQGNIVPGWAMGHTNPHVKWKDDVDVFALGDEHGVELRQDPKPLTPTQAKKAGLDKAIIDDYSYRPKGQPKLVPDHNTASEVFSNGN